jgi:hypothetical protein
VEPSPDTGLGRVAHVTLGSDWASFGHRIDSDHCSLSTKRIESLEEEKSSSEISLVYQVDFVAVI